MTNAATTNATNSIHIRATRLITGRGGEVVTDAAVRVEHGRITAAGPASEIPPKEGEASISYAGGTILPGLIDAHVHLTFRRGETTVTHMQHVSDEQALLRGVQTARQFLAAGVTTVRDLAARGRLGQALRDGVREGLIAGPRILTSGPPVTTTAGHLWALGYESDTADECRRAVRRLVKEGVDVIKVCATGGGMTPGSNTARAQYTVEQLRAVVEDAHRLGRPVAAHVHGTEGIARAVEAGVDTVEHVSWTRPEGRGDLFDERVARQMAELGVFANIASSAPRDLVRPGSGTAAPGEFRAETMGAGPAQARWRHARRLIELGVQVCFSTDAITGWYDGGHDIAYLAQVLVDHGGFAPLDVIQMITEVPARAIGLGGQVGTVEPGKLADLLVVQGNPAQDIRALHHVLAVYQEGIPVPA